MTKKHAIVVLTLSLSLAVSSASALSFRFGEEGDNSALGKIVSTLFATGKTGVALVGEVSDIATTTFTLTSKQKTYTITYTGETKVRKLGLPAKMSDVHEGDKVSVVSTVTKPEAKTTQTKLRAKVVSILSQEGEKKDDKKDKDEDKENASSSESKDDEKLNASSSKDIFEKEKREEKEESRAEKSKEKEVSPALFRK